MDSKVLTRALLLVTLFVAIVFVLILAVNGKLGGNSKPSPQTQAEDATDVVADENGQIIGSDLSAWMDDDTFFDERKIGDGKYDNEKGVPLALSVSSVEKDLRIRVLDPYGNLVRGKLFVVNVGGTTEYRDDDMDGVIYVDGLTPGDYEVGLAQMAGYVVPSEAMVCSVKAKIEYKAISDISYLIKTEADIDAEKEDTAVNDAAEESTGGSSVKTVNGASFGIDVSKYNGTIDWAKAKAAGVEFAIIRVGYRGSSTGAIVVDPYFVVNMNGAMAEGIPVGVYFFTQAVNEVEAVEEASAVMELVKAYDLKFPIFVDTEGAGGRGRADALGVEDRSRAVQSFCETVRSGGYTAGVYASKNWFNNRLDVSLLSADNVTWLAEYKDKPTYGGTYQMWQYSSSGDVDGIEGRVDMNISYLDVAN